MKRYDYYERMDYKVIETEDYLFALESFYLEMAVGIAGTNVFNIYNINKKKVKLLKIKKL